MIDTLYTTCQGGQMGNCPLSAESDVTDGELAHLILIFF